MKKLVTILSLVMGAYSVFAQGTVTFANNVGFTTADPSGGTRFVYDVGSALSPTTGVPLKGTNYAAELYYGANAGSLSPLASSVFKFRPLTTTQPGRWNATTPNQVLPGYDVGATATLQVRVWDIAKFATYEDAAAGGGITGESLPFQYTVPPGGSAASAYFMEGLQAFALVPEPSAIALGVLGVAGLLLIRRRK